MTDFCFSKEYKCGGCNAPFVYRSEDKLYTCIYCGHINSKTRSSKEKETPDIIQKIICSNCRAIHITVDKKRSRSCLYCDSSLSLIEEDIEEE